MSVRNKQTWIKDILSKSGTEITAVNEDKPEGWSPKNVALFSKFCVLLKILLFWVKLPKKSKMLSSTK